MEFFALFIDDEPDNEKSGAEFYNLHSELIGLLRRDNHFMLGLPLTSKGGRLITGIGSRETSQLERFNLTGFMVLSADNMDQVEKLLRRSPTLKNNGQILVTPVTAFEW